MSGGDFLVGVDLKKDTGRLNAAYDDAQGVTAAFNLNLLARINRELGGDFQLDGFAHRAFFNETQGRIEMHLHSRRAQTVSIGGISFDFAADETIHTENSYKYSIGEFQTLAAQACFTALHSWTDADDPHLFTETLETKLEALPLAGEAANIPWASSYWPIYEDSINYLWEGEGTLSPAAKYGAAFDIEDIEDKVSSNHGIDSINDAKECTTDDDCNAERCMRCDVTVGLSRTPPPRPARTA